MIVINDTTNSSGLSYIRESIASSADAEYPVTNLATDYVREKWKAESAGATLNFNIRSGTTAFGLAGINARNAVVSVGLATERGRGFLLDTSDSFTLDTSDSFTLAVFTEPDTVASYDFSEREVGTMVVTYEDPGVEIYIEIEMSSDAPCEAGIARAGTHLEFTSPVYGIQEGLKSNDIITTMRSGAIHIDAGNPRALKTFSFENMLLRVPKFYDFLHKVFMVNGMDPLFWRLTDSTTETVWTIYAMPQGSLPSGTHIAVDHSKIQTKLVEVI